MQPTTYTQQIRTYLQAIGAPYVLHFTQAANVPGILRHGIYPVARFHELDVAPRINDTQRLDKHPEASSVSLGFPNYRMFYKYRTQNPNTDWVVIVLNIALLWEKPSAFCCHNAADRRMRRLSLQSRMRLSALQAMFAEQPGAPTRAALGLTPYDPTDEQAEVLVLDVIEPRYIRGIVFASAAARDRYLPAGASTSTCIRREGESLFAPRNRVRKPAA